MFGPLDQMAGRQYSKVNYLSKTRETRNVTFEWEIPGKVLLEKTELDGRILTERYELDPTGTHLVKGEEVGTVSGDVFNLDREYDGWAVRKVFTARPDGVVDVGLTDNSDRPDFAPPGPGYRYVPAGMAVPEDARLGDPLADPAAWGGFARFANGVLRLTGARVDTDGRTLRFYSFKDDGQIRSFAVLRHEGGDRFAMLGVNWALDEALAGMKTAYRGRRTGDTMRLVSEADPSSTISLSIDASSQDFPKLVMRQIIDATVYDNSYTLTPDGIPGEQLIAYIDAFDRRTRGDIDKGFGPEAVTAYRAQRVERERVAAVERENARLGAEIDARQRARNANMLANLGNVVREIGQPAPSGSTGGARDIFSTLTPEEAARAAQIAQGNAPASYRAGESRPREEAREPRRSSGGTSQVSFAGSASSEAAASSEPGFVATRNDPPPPGYAPWQQYGRYGPKDYVTIYYATQVDKNEIRVLWRCVNQRSVNVSCSIGNGGDKSYLCTAPGQDLGFTSALGERGTVRAGSVLTFPSDWACRGKGATGLRPQADIKVTIE